MPNAVKHNAPESPNVVSSWYEYFHLLPECPLRDEAEEHIVGFLDSLGPSWREAWDMAPIDRVEEDRLRHWLRENPKLREQIKQRDGNRCRYCVRTVSWSDRRGPLSGTYDHVNPCAGNSLDNVVTACRSCNSKKRRRTPEQAGMPLHDPEPGLGPRLDLGGDLDPDLGGIQASGTGTGTGTGVGTGSEELAPVAPRHFIKELLTLHEQLFGSRYDGAKSSRYGAREARQAKDLIERHGFDRACALLRQFFSSHDPFIEKSGHGLGVLASTTVQNRVIAELSGRGPVGDGLDGLREFARG
jgi:hypothetical protein